MFHLEEEAKNLLWNNYRQIVKISVSGTDESFLIQEDSVLQGGLTIDRSSVTGSKIEIGSAISSELQLKLKNNEGQFDDITFESAELYVQIGIQKWDAEEGETALTYWLPMGYFIVDEPPRALTSISIKALDRMVKFDRVVNPEDLTFPMSVEDLVNECCDKCNVTLGSDLKTLPNYNYTIPAYPGSDQELTYRTLIQWCAALLGTCAFINYDGKINFKWYTQEDVSITAAERYNSDMLENDIAISGVVYTDTDKTQYLAGTDTYAFDLSANGLIQDNQEMLVTALYVKLKDLAYRPYEAAIKPTPYLFPMDMIHYTDKSGTVHNTIVTNVNYTMNAGTKIAGKGETTQNNSYSTSGTLTAQQVAIMESMKNNVDKYVDARTQAAISMNEIIANSMGLYSITVTDVNGAKAYYFCDAQTLEASNIIYTFRAGGFCWTTEWRGADTVWQYGIDREGNSILNRLLAYKITTDYLDAGSVTAEKISSEYTSDLKAYTKSALDGYATISQVSTGISQSEDSVKTWVSNTVSQTSENIKNQYTTDLNQRANDITMQVSSVQSTLSDVSQDLSEYKQKSDTYFRFNADGITIGKKENDQNLPYSININNEKMSFCQNDMEVAYVQYNKMHINAIEAVDRLSVGAQSDGGYFDFISTPQGMGVKWRAVANPDSGGTN